MKPDQGFSPRTAQEENQDMLIAAAVEKLQKQHTVGIFYEVPPPSPTACWAALKRPGEGSHKFKWWLQRYRQHHSLQKDLVDQPLSMMCSPFPVFVMLNYQQLTSQNTSRKRPRCIRFESITCSQMNINDKNSHSMLSSVQGIRELTFIFYNQLISEYQFAT